MIKEISELELVKRSHRGTVYICRSCFDNRRKITMSDYVEGDKLEIIYTLCEKCLATLNYCSQCKK